jgi:hypothetical protein
VKGVIFKCVLCAEMSCIQCFCANTFRLCSTCPPFFLMDLVSAHLLSISHRASFEKAQHELESAATTAGSAPATLTTANGTSIPIPHSPMPFNSLTTAPRASVLHTLQWLLSELSTHRKSLAAVSTQPMTALVQDYYVLHQTTFKSVLPIVIRCCAAHLQVW